MSSSPLLACLYPCRLRLISFSSCRHASCLSSRPASRLVAFLLSCGAVFRFVVRSVVPVFASVSVSSFPASRFLVLSCLSGERGDCVDAACDGTRGAVVGPCDDRGDGVRSFAVLVLPACPPLFAGIRSSRPSRHATACLLAWFSFRYGDGWMRGWDTDGETAVRMMRHASPYRYHCRPRLNGETPPDGMASRPRRFPAA